MIRRAIWQYDQWLRNRPAITNTIQGFALGFLGDALAERILPSVERDPSRSIAVTFFQGFYQGNISRVIYNSYDTAFPKILTKTKFRDGISKSLFDNFVHVPFLYTPSFFIITAAVQRLIKGEWQNGDRWGIKSLLENQWDTNVACWALWIPVMFTTFTIIPLHWQVMYVASWCVVWCGILSYFASRKSTQGEDQAQETEKPADVTESAAHIEEKSLN